MFNSLDVNTCGEIGDSAENLNRSVQQFICFSGLSIVFDGDKQSNCQQYNAAIWKCPLAMC